MVRLLADRFKLKVRDEPRPVEVYSLVVARASRGIGASPDSDTAGGSVFTAVQEHSA